MTKRPGISNRVRSGNGLIKRLFLPINCLGCDAEGDWLCPTCQADLITSRPTTCHLCAKAGDDGLCAKCRAETKLDGLVSLFPYRLPAVQRLIRTVKFGGQFDAISFFSWRYSQQLSRRLPLQAPTLVPIPLSRERLRERGFNQAALLADQLADSFQLEIWPGLYRARHTAAQAELGADERRRNVRGAFKIKIRPVPETVLLVDDVTTTGSTLTQAARVLKRGGAKEVWALTIAHG